MSEFLSQAECGVDAFERLLRIAQEPQDPGLIAEAGHAGVSHAIDGTGVVRPTVGENDALLQVGMRQGQLTEKKQGLPQHQVNRRQEGWVLGAVGQA